MCKQGDPRRLALLSSVRRRERNPCKLAYPEFEDGSRISVKQCSSSSRSSRARFFTRRIPTDEPRSSAFLLGDHNSLTRNGTGALRRSLVSHWNSCVGFEIAARGFSATTCQ